MILLCVKLNGEAQDYNFADFYTEKIKLNPSFSSATNCSSITLNYQKQYVYDFYSTSATLNFPEKKSSFSALFTNFSQGNGTFNDISASIIYTYTLQITKKSKINTALQTTYIQETINTSELIFADMINLYDGTTSAQSQELLNFTPTKKIDFSFGASYFSNKYRFGFSIFNLKEIARYNSNSKYPTMFTLHFAKHFYKFGFENNKNIIRFTPEIIFEKQKSFQQLSAGILIEKNIFFSRLWLKNNLNFNSFTPVVTLGINYKKSRISYTYGATLSKFITMPVSSNQISLIYSFKCVEKRNKNNTIYCINF